MAAEVEAGAQCGLEQRRRDIERPGDDAAQQQDARSAGNGHDRLQGAYLSIFNGYYTITPISVYHGVFEWP